ncbi:hypothetical protein [Streptacidiphilus neutrinimicus]|uniref:hypothetical protein n=1 Tax=Streptacidiphilus neutrinimicus TaxID=105420 RepID=UPI0005A90E73|nr:hypothetical protein [Streptacidiphilus neutrinimicus]
MATKEEAEVLASRARQGRFLEVLPELLDVAREDGDPDARLTAAAAAILILLWSDRFGEAGRLAEELIARDGPSGGHLCDQTMPFLYAFYGADLHDGTPAAPRLLAAAAAVPEGRVLNRTFRQAAERLASGRTVRDDLEAYYDWGAPVGANTRVIGADLLGRDPVELDARQRRTFWSALHQTRDLSRAREAYRALGEIPQDLNLAIWLAGAFAVAGEVPEGEAVLLAAHAVYWPLMQWDVLPAALVLLPTLRPVMTDRVREYYLNRPIGPEAQRQD